MLLVISKSVRFLDIFQVRLTFFIGVDSYLAFDSIALIPLNITPMQTRDVCYLLDRLAAPPQVVNHLPDVHEAVAARHFISFVVIWITAAMHSFYLGDVVRFGKAADCGVSASYKIGYYAPAKTLLVSQVFDFFKGDM